MHKILFLAFATVSSPFSVFANESVQRDATMDEFQEVIGLHVLTTELRLDTPFYPRFVLVTETKGEVKETILTDLEYPATYFKFLNITDVRDYLGDSSKANYMPKKSIRITTWVGETRQQVQGYVYNFSELDVGSVSEGSTSFLSPSNKVDTNKDIDVWHETKKNKKDNIESSQKLVLRLYAEKPTK
jgi:hypothetical protein